MLIDQKMFEQLENDLTAKGIIDRFEQEQGKIRGRMMITRTDIPDELTICIDQDRRCMAFEASFDFYDVSVGIALYMDTGKPASGIWFTPHSANNEPPANEWIEFFIRTLLESFS